MLQYNAIDAKITVVLWNKILNFIEEYDIINTHQFYESIIVGLLVKCNLKCGN